MQAIIAIPDTHNAEGSSGVRLRLPRRPKYKLQPKGVVP